MPRLGYVDAAGVQRYGPPADPTVEIPDQTANQIALMWDTLYGGDAPAIAPAIAPAADTFGVWIKAHQTAVLTAGGALFLLAMFGSLNPRGGR